MENLKIEEPQTVLCKIDTPTPDTFFDVNLFMELFVEGAPLFKYVDKIFGIATFNYHQKIYTVSFNPNVNETEIESFVSTFNTPTNIQTPDGLTVTMNVRWSRFAKKIVTLYPMPFDINPKHLQTLTATWGDLESYNFGRHKKFSFIRNPYLHLKFSNLQVNNIPEVIKVNDRFITVILPGEENVPRCGYCKAKSHTLENCFLKPKPNQPRSYAQVSKNQLPKPSLPPFKKTTEQILPPRHLQKRTPIEPSTPTVNNPPPNLPKDQPPTPHNPKNLPELDKTPSVFDTGSSSSSSDESIIGPSEEGISDSRKTPPRPNKRKNITSSSSPGHSPGSRRASSLPQGKKLAT